MHCPLGTIDTASGVNVAGTKGNTGLYSRVVQRTSRILRFWLRQVLGGLSFRIADDAITMVGYWGVCFCLSGGTGSSERKLSSMRK